MSPITDIRSEFILTGVLHHFVKDASLLYPDDAKNNNEKRLLKHLVTTIGKRKDDFGYVKDAFSYNFDKDDLRLFITDYYKAELSSTADWSKIVKFLAFLGTAAAQSKMPQAVYTCAWRLFRDRLEPWMAENGGWQALLPPTDPRKRGFQKTGPESGANAEIEDPEEVLE